MFTLKYRQRVPLSLEACWEFFSSPANLKTITPTHLDFKMKSASYEGKMYPGQLIAYTIRPVLNFPIEWVTEITHVEELTYFIDEQRFGPYKFWHHEHRFYAISGGVEMVDTISYKVPFGFLGKLLNHLKIKSDIEEIFAYRRTKLEEIFGIYSES